MGNKVNEKKVGEFVYVRAETYRIGGKLGRTFGKVIRVYVNGYHSLEMIAEGLDRDTVKDELDDLIAELQKARDVVDSIEFPEVDA